MGQVRRIVLPGHAGSGVPQHLRQLLGFHPISQGGDGACVPQVRKSDMVESSFYDNLLVHPAHHLRRVRFQRGRVHKHERAAGVLAVLHDEKVDHLRGQPY